MKETYACTKTNCDVAKRRHFITKVSYTNVSVLVWTKWNWLRLRRLQTALFCSNVLQRQKWQHFAKNKRLSRTESLLIQTIFTEYKQKETLLMRIMSSIMPILRHVRFFCTFAKWYNWHLANVSITTVIIFSAKWFCKTIGDFVLLYV